MKITIDCPPAADAEALLGWLLDHGYRITPATWGEVSVYYEGTVDNSNVVPLRRQVENPFDVTDR